MTPPFASNAMEPHPSDILTGGLEGLSSSSLADVRFVGPDPESFPGARTVFADPVGPAPFAGRDRPRSELWMRLCEGYGRLFAFRKDINPGATKFHELTLKDPELASARIAEFEYDKADRFLNGFPERPALAGRGVLDLGCRNGGSTVRYAVLGAAHVTGLDIDARFFKAGRAIAQRFGAEDRVDFRVSSDTSLPVSSNAFDVALAEDVIEHLRVPEAILYEVRRALRPGGRFYLRFGPLWFHPHGVHLWEIFPGPWTHVIFPEDVVCEVRRRAKRSQKVGLSYADLGLNQMSVARFRRVIKRTGFGVAYLRVLGMRGMDRLAGIPGLGELFATEIEAVLVKPR